MQKLRVAGAGDENRSLRGCSGQVTLSVRDFLPNHDFPGRNRGKFLNSEGTPPLAFIASQSDLNFSLQPFLALHGQATGELRER
jgi:hypothetical protein